MSEMIDKVLPALPEVLLNLARDEFADNQFDEQRPLLVERVLRLLEAQKEQFPEQRRHYLHAVVYNLRNQPETAIESYRRALALEPFQVEWRFELAVLLRKQGRLKEALDEAEFCLSLAPGRKELRNLVYELNRIRLRRFSAKPKTLGY